MSRSMTLVKAKANFSEAVRSAELGEPVLITRHGKAVAALVSAEELARVQALRAAGPKRGLASLAGGWKGSEELIERVLEHRRSGPRSVPDLDRS